MRLFRRQTQQAHSVAPAAAGFVILEVMLAVSLLVLALLANVRSTVAEQQLTEQQRTRSEALLAAKQLLAHMRSDEDWEGLYDRLRDLQALASQPGGGEPRLDDGRKCWLPTVYYPDFAFPGDLKGFRVLVDVPAATLSGYPSGPAVLREDLVDARFGLPTDLNGDGTVDGSSRNDDYAVLPVSLTFRWEPRGAFTTEMRVDTWIGGER